MTKSLIDTFNDYFRMVPALTDELKNEVYKLRYQVYCLETGFEDPGHYPEGLEFDVFDSHSVHYLLYNLNAQCYMATTRLILPVANDPNEKYPIELFCPIDNMDALAHIDRRHLAEASRFCVSKAFRRRKNEMSNLMGIGTEAENVFTAEERRIFPQITLALFACLIKMSYENNIHDWYAVMEPALIRIFSTLGMNFIGIGPITDYHGNRRPCTIKVSDLLDGVKQKDINSWNLLTNNGTFWQN